MSSERPTPLLERADGGLIVSRTPGALVPHESSVTAQVLKRLAQVFMLTCLISTSLLLFVQFMLTGASAGLQYYIWIPALGAIASLIWAIPVGGFLIGSQWFRTRDIDHDHPTERLNTQHFKTITIPFQNHERLELHIRRAIGALDDDICFNPDSRGRTIEARYRGKYVDRSGLDVGVRIVRTTHTHAELFVWSMYHRKMVVFDGGSARRVLNKLVDALTRSSSLPELPDL